MQDQNKEVSDLDKDSNQMSAAQSFSSSENKISLHTIKEQILDESGQSNYSSDQVDTYNLNEK